MRSQSEAGGTIAGSRRTFLGVAAGVGAAVIAQRGLANAHAAGSDEIRVALVGCGGRGSGATADALSVTGAPLRVHAMADIFRDRIGIARRSLTESFKERIDVPDERAFVGVSAYRRALECLRPGDIVILATPPGFRAPHFAAAIERGVHVFMEKPASIDGPSTRRIIELAGLADRKRLKVAVGLMCRHCDRRRELHDRLRTGEAGDLVAFRGYRIHPAVQSMELFPGPPEGMTELQWQVNRFHSFLWASGGIYSDYYVHHMDEVCWMKDAWPVMAEAVGARHFRARLDDQNFDTYSIEYTFEDGIKFFYSGQHMKDRARKFAVHGMGTKGAFTISGSGHSPAKSTIYRGQKMDKDSIAWTAAQPEPNPYRREWEHFVAAILADEPYNEAVRGAQASLVTAMGRYAAHTGRPVTYDEMLGSPDDLTAGIEALDDDSPPLLTKNEDGRYPVPTPGRYRHEYRD